jgi:hypothetical protein
VSPWFFLHSRGFYSTVEAAPIAGMASYPGLFYLYQYCVRIAVIINFLYFLEIAGGLTFQPELAAGTAPEMSLAGFQCPADG